MEEIDSDDPIVKFFDDKNSIEDLNKYQLELFFQQDEPGTKIVEFNLSNKRIFEEAIKKEQGINYKMHNIFPYFWGQLHKDYDNYATPNQKIAFRYVLFKMIDSSREEESETIACYNCYVSGKIFKLRNSFEE
jgi:hypothetical protein